MLRLVNKAIVVTIASVFIAVSVVPTAAMPISGMNVAGVDSGSVQRVDSRGHYGERRNEWGRHRGDGRRHYGNRGRGRPHSRHNHHRNYGPRHNNNKKGWNNDALVPLALLGAGALIIGGAMAGSNNNAPRVNSGLNPRHYDWCEKRYRSYRFSDNTFQPYRGSRQQCLSPYY